MTRDRLQTIFVTGATGFLGQYAVRDLLHRDIRLVLLLRPPLDDSRRRLTEQLARIGVDIDPLVEQGRVLIVPGALPDGLPKPEWGHTDAILHCAACLQLLTSSGNEPYTTNVGGVEAIIDWADRHDVKHIHTVSTAYTCGWNSGTIREVFHDPKPEFQTDYERSKWTAEHRFRDWSEKPGRSLTIYRPSFLIGDSATGYTSQFGGFYQFGWLVSLLKSLYHDPTNGKLTHINMRVPGRPEDPQNIVPVDFVARVMSEIIAEPALQGRIYHLTNPHPPTNGFMKTCCEEYFGLEGGYFCDPAEFNKNRLSAAESLMWDQYYLLTPRVVHNPLFDMSNTREVMQAVGLEFPLVDRELVFKLFDYAASRHWGRGNGHRGG